MRAFVILIAASGLSLGCQSKSKSDCCPTTAPSHVLVAPQPQRDEDVAASALVFAPPIAANDQPLDLARDTRERAAFVGYDQTTTTFSFVETDDRQGGFNFNTGDRFWRRAVSARVGVSTR